MSDGLQPTEQYIRDLAKELRRGHDALMLPHRVVLHRLAQLLYPRPLVLADAVSTIREGTRTTDGVILVFTDTLLAMLTFEGADREVSGFNERDLSVVNVQIVPRTALSAIAIVQTDSRDSANAAYSFVDGIYEDGLPYGAQLSLTYEGLDGPVLLPGKAHRSDAVPAAFVSRLLDDLTQR